MFGQQVSLFFSVLYKRRLAFTLQVCMSHYGLELTIVEDQ